MRAELNDLRHDRKRQLERLAADFAAALAQEEELRNWASRHVGELVRRLEARKQARG
jgi:hypothetical protein